MDVGKQGTCDVEGFAETPREDDIVRLWQIVESSNQHQIQTIVKGLFLYTSELEELTILQINIQPN
jgi:hypothetical protein